MRGFAVFDFDKTIVSKDMYQEFLIWLIRQSWLRTLFAVLIFPFVFPLLHCNLTSLFAINFFSIVALYFQNENIFSLRNGFLNYFYSNEKWFVFKEAKEAIDFHRFQGQTVLIISGCPQWLLISAMQRIGLRNCKVIGSKQIIHNGSLKIVDYCYSTNKIRMAQLKKFDVADWDSGYSDSLSDLPFLELCKKRYIVNPRPKEEKKFKQRLLTNCQIVKWVTKAELN